MINLILKPISFAYLLLSGWRLKRKHPSSKEGHSYRWVSSFGNTQYICTTKDALEEEQRRMKLERW